MTYVADQPLISTLIAVTCCRTGCGVTFGIENSHRNYLLESHEFFYCPNGHSQHYTKKTEAERLKEQLSLTKMSLFCARNDLDSERDRRGRAERSVSARKAVITRMKRRVKKGRCVCCSQEFKDLKRHMKLKHPKFEPENHVAALEVKGAKK